MVIRIVCKDIENRPAEQFINFWFGDREFSGRPEKVFVTILYYIGYH